ncbi:hypothetical protein I307_00524 [Cryptococcus deuterogattii 99/473]|uniref:Uncharacterized protein n=1 Tax=Cryptococcus deuterogattii Ram5 TaxID=1296110 RepID=A0A0D0U0S3_9TREE|nr:hypothetical protein I309_02903 [Cryptococcus deuterogattii LA55]KIR33449.1 hypothetical protein I352_04218 [Cryptococcus deuterogattii MMRL2647]KIR41808.1 hypothetical protein I313_01968 [Cryptococcus deuterogattii Ram5]KIR73367.1 hypothetical protein I310_03033 [Cryptococcus deuterogattii CA1014]KIR91702.1 hypothetical protein I304_04526 [Cryptococcus deuterogattii CBS 10090]KIR99123.1 hypothetical protein L804_03745 [Cryptococcus deuterogattii 2001/935-1]KIY60078.1 hypothetical protein 
MPRILFIQQKYRTFLPTTTPVLNTLSVNQCQTPTGWEWGCYPVEWGSTLCPEGWYA